MIELHNPLGRILDDLAGAITAVAIREKQA